MSLAEFADSIRPEILGALERKGFTTLTAVQRVVLDPELAGRDLRMTSQTGSGKTVAIGLTLRELPLSEAAAQSGIARPVALVITPTRELAQQVEQELTWLYADAGVRVACTTGGSSYRTESRAFARGPGIVVGTPGRLLDHLRRGAIDSSQVEALVLDEADRMLELGFREDLEAIFECMPERRVTHLVSATFPRALSTLADSVQRDPVRVEGTLLGAANADIDHVIHIVDPHERGAAITNLLLAHPDDQTLVFVRTRADASELASVLSRAGFAASGLSGDMEQAARNRALSQFREGQLRVLVATDVAARGIDVSSVTRVLHAEPPSDPDAYTHRSGRTGRAGRKGVSALLLAPSRVVQATRLLRGLGVEHRFEQVPTPEQIMRAQDERLFQQLTATPAAVEVEVDDSADSSGAPRAETPEPDERYLALARRLVEHGSVERCLALLLERTYQSAQPRKIRAFPQSMHRDRDRPRGQRDERTRADAGPREFVMFRVSWGKQDGADARRVLAMICRRGGIRGSDVGPIRIEQHYTNVGVDSEVAAAFERAASRNDAREPNVHIRRDQRAGGDKRPERKPQAEAQPRGERKAQSDAHPRSERKPQPEARPHHAKPFKPGKGPKHSKAAKQRAAKRAATRTHAG
ncbi:MAG TPA: DEAD/DEAH box helicase [Polyangiales bacterium]|nr:DEAD/DEAH box helicase [Polyangiales bacterium]